MEVLERKAAITGIGQSEVGRRLGRDPLALTVDACLEAIEDAGLTRSDIDGLSTYPGAMMAGAPGFSGAGIVDVQDALRLNLNWYCGGIEFPGQLGIAVPDTVGLLARDLLQRVREVAIAVRARESDDGSAEGAHAVILSTR